MSPFLQTPYEGIIMYYFLEIYLISHIVMFLLGFRQRNTIFVFIAYNNQSKKGTFIFPYLW